MIPHRYGFHFSLPNHSPSLACLADATVLFHRREWCASSPVLYLSGAHGSTLPTASIGCENLMCSNNAHSTLFLPLVSPGSRSVAPPQPTTVLHPLSQPIKVQNHSLTSGLHQTLVLQISSVPLSHNKSLLYNSPPHYSVPAWTQILHIKAWIFNLKRHSPVPGTPSRFFDFIPSHYNEVIK